MQAQRNIVYMEKQCNHTFHNGGHKTILFENFIEILKKNTHIMTVLFMSLK